MQDPRERQMLVEKGRDIVADVEDQPDGDEAGDAIEIGLQKIPQDIAIEESHKICEFRISNCDLNYRFPGNDFSGCA